MLSQLDATEGALKLARQTVAASVADGDKMSPAGAWLLDNFFVVLEQVPEIRATLPPQYYQELPKLAGSGALAGYPRIYAIIIELIAHTDGRLDEQTVALMISGYQSVTPLTLGELWAIPAMLRLGYLDNVRRMALRAARDTSDRARADEWVSRLLPQIENSTNTSLSDFVHMGPDMSPAFITRFLQQIRSRRTDFTPLLWLEQWMAEDGLSVEDAAQRSVQELALTQLVMANSIESLRLVVTIDWTAFVESASVTEAILRTDPSNTYAGMTRATRDLYRHAVERIAKQSKRDEPSVAAAAVAAAEAYKPANGHVAREHHVGYHLVGEGRRTFERNAGVSKAWFARTIDAILRNPGRFYSAAIVGTALGVLSLLLVPLWMAGAEPVAGLWWLVAITVALLPSLDVAIALVHQVVTIVIPPQRLPRLDFEFAVPEQNRTIVVVPLLFGSIAGVEHALEHIEVLYLANRDRQIRFAVLSDFLDAAEQSLPADDAIIAAAIEGVRSLNDAYRGDGDTNEPPFYLLHRTRRWNAADSIWMGWERKRGKLVEFNDYITGANHDAFSTAEGDLPWLQTAVFVITLDADTMLPRGGAPALIGTMAHPLNRAEFDESCGRVTRGFGILQPRVSVSLASARESRFASVYAGHPGVDPYTTAVSDVYQDLFGEGTFTGKGIYDVDIFRRATEGRFPENALLSHDLIEGAFARAGLASEVEVYDDYPTRYLTATRRAHRWIRGDWQLLRWIMPEVPGSHGKTSNPLSALSRWKIVDNMRRSLTPIVTLSWLILGWTVLPGSGIAWTLLAFAAFATPWIAPLIISSLRPPRAQSWFPYYSGLLHDASLALQQLGLALVLLPDQALLAADAISRTIARVLVTRRHMLEWQTASQVERTTGVSRLFVWKRMWPAVLLGMIIVMAVGAHVRMSAGGSIHLLVVIAWILLTVTWFFSPEMAIALSKPLTRRDLVLDDDERTIALRYAEKHWRYFATFVTAETNWLVPDNFQETPDPIVAPRTSPTNIGLQLLSTMSAADLGIITRTEMFDLLERTFGTLDRMERVHGHFYNWYDVNDLRALDPPYVSSVDSGNFAGHLMAMAQACLEIAEQSPSEDSPHSAQRVAEAARAESLAQRARLLAMQMDFRLVYNTKRRLFAIGYDARSGKLDESSYDLLASEARLLSFVAISKGDAPVEHWFRLGRSLTVAEGATSLVSWSGSMFEYLMPLLVMPPRPFSLLDQTCHAAVHRQIRHGRTRGVPWGISESAYNLRDRHETYQYRAFGVPDLALKRGLSNELVVAPYASALATSVDAHVALHNLGALERRGAFGAYGFYDALDYTRRNEDNSVAIVRTYMAHHIGMSLVALTNALSLEDSDSVSVWQQRFMNDAAVRATSLLLDERVPRRYVPRASQLDPSSDMIESTVRTEISVHEIDSPNTPEPHVLLLGSTNYSVLLTNSGAGHSSAGGNDVFRWRADATLDDTGHWIYVKDLASGSLWSAGHQPVRKQASKYSATFSSDRAVFRRSDGPVDTRMEIVVIGGEQAEIRRVTLVNRSRVVREMEITSYGEVVLCPAAADRAHPAFQKLFIQTEWVPGSTLLASRRPRSSEESWPWCAHVVAAGPERINEITYETDRAQFIGRGRSTHSPRAMDDKVALTGSTGAVLDPIVAIRVRVRIEPGRSAMVAFTTAVAPTRVAALQLADRYRNLTAAERALSLARTEAQVELRDFDIAPEDVGLYQELAGALIYPHEALRASEGERATVKRGQSALWSMGISGDWPIVLATIRATTGLSSVRQLLLAHRYWRSKGIRSDLVILNERPYSYIQELHDQIMTMTMSSSEGGVIDQPGGVYIRRADTLAPDDIALLRTTARIHIVCDGIGLGAIVAANIESHASLVRETPAVPTSHVTAVAGARNTPASGQMVIPANTYGELARDNSFAIRVSGAHVPPAPWANVIANPRMGFCVTERGCGFTWAENSFFYRLTPWFNDPLTDPCGEALYLRDTVSGDVWSATPAPITAGSGTYEVTHEPGITSFRHERNDIATKLTLGVPVSDTVKISRLRIRNRGTTARRLSLTSYVEWVLGAEREHTRHQLHTRRDPETGALLAQNYYAPDFDSRIAFSWLSEPVTSHTSRRDHFIGRNSDLSDPVAMREEQLSGISGAGYDSCAALRCALELDPGAEHEIVLLLGSAANEDELRTLIKRHGQLSDAALSVGEAVAAWNNRLSVISAHTPDPQFDALLNRWSLYQALACRMWARSALYQSSGAYGFRDQLQDCMAFVYATPEIARAHILKAASRQFIEGDVQHWWHEPSGRGVRTRFSDDLVWLAFVTDHYVNVTGDTRIWDESVSYLSMRVLEPEEQEVYDLPQQSDMRETLHAHCVRALDHACTAGAHGLPLIGAGDWNDGMNRVGVNGAGESVWLAWFLSATLRRFAVHADGRGDVTVATRYRSRADSYVAAAEATAWDGSWYRRAFYDDGTPLGSAENSECSIDAIAQSWSVISGGAQHTRAATAMQSVNERLVKQDARMILLLTPPFDKTTHDPGYIKGYVPGVRENGAQYTHAALWTVLAMAKLGDGDRAHELLRMLNPLTHAETRDAADRYMVEPYAIAADVYAGAHEGRGGWTWYTGSASWSYRVALEGILGFEKTGSLLRINPVVPAAWKEFSIDYRHGSATYSIAISNPQGVSSGVSTVTLDGVMLTDGVIRLVDDGAQHVVAIVMGAPRSSRA